MAANKNVIAALKAIKETGRVSKEVGEPLLKQGLINVNMNDVDPAGNAAAILTDSGNAELAPKSKKKAESVMSNTSFEVITNAVPPESRRGAGRTAGPSKYPFDQLPVGGSFFVAASEEMQNVVKALGSSVSNANNKYKVETGESKSVTRTKRGPGNKAVLDEAGHKVKETVTVPVYKAERHFIIRGVEAGKKYGDWVAPANGALISRQA